MIESRLSLPGPRYSTQRPKEYYWVQGIGFIIRVEGVVFMVWGLGYTIMGFRVSVAGVLGILILGFKGLGFKVEFGFIDLGFRVMEKRLGSRGNVAELRS